MGTGAKVVDVVSGKDILSTREKGGNVFKKKHWINTFYLV